MEKYYTSILTDQKGCGLSPYYVEVCTQEYETWNMKY